MTERHRAHIYHKVRICSDAPYSIIIAIMVPAVVMVSIVGQPMFMGLLDRPSLAGEASYGCICRPTVVGTKVSQLLTTNTTGWVSTGWVGLPLAGSCGVGGAGEGEGGTLPTATLLGIGTLETGGGAGETREVPGRSGGQQGTVWLDYIQTGKPRLPVSQKGTGHKSNTVSGSVVKHHTPGAPMH